MKTMQKVTQRRLPPQPIVAADPRVGRRLPESLRGAQTSRLFVVQIACDLHKKFTNATARDAPNRVVGRQRLEHAGRATSRTRLRIFPAGTPVLCEAIFGWDWFTDERRAAGLEPHLASSRESP